MNHLEKAKRDRQDVKKVVEVSKRLRCWFDKAKLSSLSHRFVPRMNMEAMILLGLPVTECQKAQEAST